MSTTATPHTVTNGHPPTSTVYVQVPPSPFVLQRYHSLSTPSASATWSSTKVTSTHVSLVSGRLKENTPVRPSRRLSTNKKSSTMLSSTSGAATTSAKRKLSDREGADDTPLTSKRVRSISNASGAAGVASVPLKPTQLNSPTRADDIIEVDASKACPEFPNGWTYCHQCCKKRDLGDTIHCTAIDEREVGKSNNKVVKQKRCVNKFCRACLKNRYGEDMDVLRTNKKREPGQVDNAGYIFKCPKCKDECNCPRCRKQKGLEPIGTMVVRKPAPASKKDKPKAMAATASQAEFKKGRPKAQKKVKTLAPVKWTRIAPALTQSEIEERIYIREFILRFNHLSEASIPKGQLEELEQLNGNGKAVHNLDELDEISWVGDACAKSVIMSLLGLFALAGGENPRIVRESEATLRTLRTAGLQLNKVWSTLVDWRNAVNAGVAPKPITKHQSKSNSSGNLSTTSSLTDLSSSSCSSPPDGENDDPISSYPSMINLSQPRTMSLNILVAVDQGRRATRGMTSVTTSSNGNSVVILSSSQMIPVILSMIEHILKLGVEALREDLDEKLKTSKDMVRKVRECIKGEGERWEVQRREREALKGKDKTKDKSKFQAAKKLHKDILTALDHSASLVQSEYMLRYSPLGTDLDGRVYYALSPGAAEREAALEYFDIIREQGSNPRAKLKRKGRVVKPQERDDLTEFSWMILVWGQIPNDKEAFCPNVPGSDNDSDSMSVDGHAPLDDPEKERWYAFSQPEDIKHLAEWVAADNGLDDKVADKAPSENDPDGPMKRLVTSLKCFAELLEWRGFYDKYRLPNEPLDAPANGSVGAASAKVSAKTKAIPPEQFYSK